MAKSFVIIVFTILFGLNHVSEKQYNHTNDKNQIIEISLKRSSSSCEAVELDLSCLSLYYGSDGISCSFHTNEESLGAAKLQEHVKTYWHVVLVIGHIEIDYSLVLAVF